MRMRHLKSTKEAVVGGTTMWQEIWESLQKPTTSPTVHYVSAHGSDLPPENVGADILAKISMLAPSQSSELADWVAKHSGHHSG